MKNVAIMALTELPPLNKADESPSTVVFIDNYRWKKHCRGLFELPIAA
jgi:hypothetical protein